MPDGLPPIDRIDLRFRAEPVRVRSSWLPGSVWIWFTVGIVAGILGWHFGQRQLTGQLEQRMRPESHPGDALIALDALEVLGTEDSALFVQGLSHSDVRVARSAFEKLNALIAKWHNLEPSVRYAQIRGLAEQLDRVPRDLAEEQAALVRSLAASLYSACIAVNDPQLQSTANRCLGLLRFDSATANWNNPGQLASADLWSPPDRLDKSNDTPEIQRPGSPTAVGVMTGDSRVPVVPAMRPASLIETQAVRSNNSLRLNDRGSPEGVREETVWNDNSQAELSYEANNRMQEKVHPIQASLDDQPPDAVETSGPTLVSSQTAVRRAASQDLASEQPLDPILRQSSEPPRELPVMVRTPASIASHPVVRMKLVSDKPDLDGIQKAENAELIKLLGNAHAEVAKAAALALKHRGFHDSEIALASELAVASGERRIELMKQIAQSNVIAPQPWLLWMAEDGEPEVRRMAISLLSSMQNEQVQRTLRMLLFREQNQDIQDLIRKVLLSGSPG